MKLIKWLLYFVALICIIALSMVAYIAIKVDPNDYKDQIAEQVKQQTGRDFAINGDITWRFYPTLGIQVGDVSLGNQAGFEPAQMLQADSAKVQVEVLPLMEKRIEVGKIELDRPTLNLAIDANGVANWSDLIDAKTPAEPAAADAGAQVSALLGGLIVKGVDINGGAVSWSDASAGQSLNVTDFDLETGEIRPGEAINFKLHVNLQGSLLPDLTSVAACGALTVREDLSMVELTAAKLELVQDQIDLTVDLGHLKVEPELGQLEGRAMLFSGRYDQVPVDGEIDNLSYDLNTGMLVLGTQSYSAKLLGTQAIARLPGLNFSLKDEHLSVPELALQMGEANMNLSVEVNDLFSNFSAKGELDTQELSPRMALSRFGFGLDALPPGALQSLRLRSGFQATVDSISLPNLSANVDQSTVIGSFDLLSMTKPAYRFKLDVDQLQLDQYLSQDNQESAAQAGPAAVVALPFVALKGLDAKGSVRFGEFEYQGLAAQNLLLDVDATKDKISVSPLRAKLYGGEITNEIVYDISGSAPKLSVNSHLSQIQLAQFLPALQLTQRIEGAGNVKAQFNSSGLTTQELMANLNGNLDLKLDDGAITGVNVQRALVQVAQLVKGLKGQALTPTVALGDKTEFSNLSAKIRANNGVLVSENIDLQAPGLRLRGRGNIDLNTQLIDLQMVVAVVKSLEGQGGLSLDELSGKKLPLTIAGTLSEPKIKIDTNALIAARLKKELESELAEQLGVDLSKDPETGEAVAPEDALKAKIEAEKAKLKQKLKKKLLEGLFGG